MPAPAPQPPPPIETGPRFRPLHWELMTLLRALEPVDWAEPTEAPGWPVRRVVAHLVDTMLRRLSLHRDGHQPPPTGPVDGDLLGFLDRLNATWIEATDRLSPDVLVGLLDRFGPESADFLASLPPDGEAKWPVAWAGEATSRNWMDVGREYTERWHHQQQIRSAVGAPLLIEPQWLIPIVGLGVRALPVAYGEVEAAEGTAVLVTVAGPSGGRWLVARSDGRWHLGVADGRAAAAEVTLPEDLAWRTWYSSRRSNPTTSLAVVRGDPVLVAPCFRSRALMV